MEQIELYYFDTNILTSVNALINFFREKNINLDYFGEIQSKNQFKNIITDNFSEYFHIGALYSGYKILNFLCNLNNEKTELLTSNICDWEIRSGFLERQANENLIKLGVPFRLRKGGRYTGSIYYHNLGIQDFQNMENELDSIKEFLSTNYSIEIKIIEEINEIPFNGIIEISNILIAHTYIEIPDLWILSVGLISMPNYIVTNDNLFQDILSNIYNPPDDWWQNLRTRIVKIIAKYSAISIEKVIIPEIKRI